MTISTPNNIVQTGDFLLGQHKLAGFLLALNNFLKASLLECQLPFQEDNEERIKLAECLMKQDKNAPSLLELFEDIDTDKIKNDERCRKYSAIFSIIITFCKFNSLFIIFLEW
jgi:hypothetical protein